MKDITGPIDEDLLKSQILYSLMLWIQTIHDIQKERRVVKLNKYILGNTLHFLLLWNFTGSGYFHWVPASCITGSSEKFNWYQDIVLIMMHWYYYWITRVFPTCFQLSFFWRGAEWVICCLFVLLVFKKYEIKASIWFFKTFSYQYRYRYWVY